MPISKAVRQRWIREILEQEVIGTHRDLQARLAARGASVTQATISRDLREMGVVRIPIGRGRSRYVLPAPVPAPKPEPEQVRSVFQQFIMDVRGTGNLVLIKTTPSAAPAVADLLDRLAWPELLGTVAGEDTILAVLNSARHRGEFIRKLDRFRRTT
ncbi:Arginine repressor [bacterium HR11]|nr:Arginine repressor [bacterium HR11]